MKNIHDIQAIYPGTFDPITKGHIEIIKRASKIFQRIIVGVAEGHAKSPTFSLAERVSMVEQDVRQTIDEHVVIEVIPFYGLLVDFAKEMRASVIIRGLRAVSDFEYEFQMAYMNHKINSEVETLFLPANESGHFISSRFVKEMARLGGSVEGFVSKEVAIKLYERFRKI